VASGNTVRTDPRSFTATVAGDFSSNRMTANGRNGVLFGFTRLQVSLSQASAAQWKYLDHSTFRFSGSAGEMAGFDLDHPAIDPPDGRMLANGLLVNGTEIANGVRISP